MKLKVSLLFCCLGGVLISVATPLQAEPSDQAVPFVQAVKAYESGDSETARMLFEAILAENPRNKAARSYLHRITAKSEGINVLENQMKEIVLPSVNFQDVAPREAFLYVSQQVEKQTGGKNHLNVVWLAPTDGENRITLTLQNIPVSEVLHYLAASADLRVVYDRNAIKVLPPLTQ